MIAPARIAAYDILTAVSAGNADLATAIAFARGGLRDERDRALASEISTGVLRWRAALDHVIATLAKRPLDRLDHEIVEILRLSAYQLLHLTRVPASAVVDDAVNLTKRAGKTSAAGFVNAILRTISRKRAALPLPGRPVDPTDRAAALAYFTTTLSHPQWLAERWYDRLGFGATERWLTFDNSPAPLTLRPNGVKATPADLIVRLEAADVEAHRAEYAPDALVVDEGSPLPLVEEGLCFIQDEASQLVAALAADLAGRRVLDTCASPGGKTTAIAASLGNGGRVVACDVRERRMALLRRTVEISGAENVRFVQADLLKPLPFSQAFDLVFVDVPCSGLGTLRRDPDIRWRRREADLALFAAAELTMLQRATDVVAPGGRLVYATCSSEPEENEGVAQAFLATTSGFAKRDVRDMASRIPPAVVDAHGDLRTTPDQHGLEAFYACVFERQP
jgi:16S rRNA (cytosine967-C5)-methyltransferase